MFLLKYVIFNTLNHVGWTQALQNVFWGLFGHLFFSLDRVSLQSLLENAGNVSWSRIREERWLSWTPGKEPHEG